MAKRYQLESYRKCLLNRVTANAAFTEYIENCLVRDDEVAKHSFHKIMIHDWSGTDIQLFDVLSEYFSNTVIPVMYSPNPEVTSFYTSNLSLILRIIKLDFMFPFQRNMFNIDILFNDKSSTDCFNSTITLEDIVSGIVSRRLSDSFELNLSYFCSDSEFIENKIYFYKISLLAHFKILMLRMGRDAKALNLSNNNLSQVPLDILNFFIKGDLTSINLSNNQIPSLRDVSRVNSKIEKLRLEGNPLCDELSPADYVKTLLMKIPRLIELDGIKINQHGCIFPFFKNFLVTPDRKTKMCVEKFLILYFSHYDTHRQKLCLFYDSGSKMTINCDFTDVYQKSLQSYLSHSRNALDPKTRTLVVHNKKLYRNRNASMASLVAFPGSYHDPSTFTVDVMHHDGKSMIIVVDGVYREKNKLASRPNRPVYTYYQFRRTFVMGINLVRTTTQYYIKNEMFTVRTATSEQVENSFKHVIRNLNELTLVNPDDDDIDDIVKAFMHITGLKKLEAEARLKLQDWDIRKALKLFVTEFSANKVGLDRMVEDDDFSDTSSLIEDEID